MNPTTRIVIEIDLLAEPMKCWAITTSADGPAMRSPNFVADAHQSPSEFIQSALYLVRMMESEHGRLSQTKTESL